MFLTCLKGIQLLTMLPTVSTSQAVESHCRIYTLLFLATYSYYLGLRTYTSRLSLVPRLIPSKRKHVTGVLFNLQPLHSDENGIRDVITLLQHYTRHTDNKTSLFLHTGM